MNSMIAITTSIHWVIYTSGTACYYRISMEYWMDTKLYKESVFEKIRSKNHHVLFYIIIMDLLYYEQSTPCIILSFTSGMYFYKSFRSADVLYLILHVLDFGFKYFYHMDNLKGTLDGLRIINFILFFIIFCHKSAFKKI